MPAVAQQQADGEKLDKIERALDRERKQRDALKKKASTLGLELTKLRARSVSAAQEVQGHEAAILEIEDKLEALSKSEAEKIKGLRERRGQFVHVLMALQRMARHPPEAMIAAPMSPSDTVRGAILLRAAVPEIEIRAKSLRSDLAALIENRARTLQRRKELASATERLMEQRKVLDSLMAEKFRLKKRADEKSRLAAKQVGKLAGEARNLRELLRKLQQHKKNEKAKEKQETVQAKKPANPVRIKPQGKLARSHLPYPAVGRLVGRYGEQLETGLTRKGITIETHPGAQVVVPNDGQVVFAGAFKGYGQLLIIEHAGGYHSLLAGLSRIDNIIGQQVQSGEPAGVMAGAFGDPDRESPILYVELRREGQPINPLPWLAARKGKVNG